MNLGLKSLKLKGGPTDERDELLTTLAVRSARPGGMRLWRDTGSGAQGLEGRRRRL